jgi:hypothetical protein
MRLSFVVSLFFSLTFVPLAEHFLAQAALEVSPPLSTWVRFYERDNCDVQYHNTGVKDFARAKCGPALLPGSGAPESCVTGRFTSYRLEEDPSNKNLPKLDELVSQYEF